MTMATYQEQILEPVVLPWLKRGDRFVLEDDGASCNRLAWNDNGLRGRKKNHGLKYHVNMAGSPDLTPIEKAWETPKAHLKEHAIWDEDTLREAAEEGWEAVTESSINGWVHSMPRKCAM
jgi:hypothetical protein